MPLPSLIQLYVNVLTKAFVSVNGSPVAMPTLYYGDAPTVNIYPVVPVDSNPSHGYQTFDLTGNTMNLTLSDTPNAASPPTPFAAIDGMTWVKPSSGLSYFTGLLNLATTNAQTFIGNASGKQAWYSIDVFDSTPNRSTLILAQVPFNASNDTPGAAPPQQSGNPYITANMLKNLCVPIKGTPGGFFTLVSPDGTKTALISLGNDGKFVPLPQT